jgi:hypothetical protein
MYEDSDYNGGAYAESTRDYEVPSKKRRTNVSYSSATGTRTTGDKRRSNWPHADTDSYRPGHNSTSYRRANIQSTLGGLASGVNGVCLDQRSHRTSHNGTAGPHGHPQSAQSSPRTPLTSRPFEFSHEEKKKAKNRLFQIGDLVSHEYIRQARLNPRWVRDEDTGEWHYTEKNVHHVSTGFDTNPAVHCGMRNGVITEIYEGDSYLGPVAKVIPEFSYSNTGLKDKNAEFCAEHLAIMHDEKAVDWEKYVANQSKTTSDPHLQVSIEDNNPHPYAPWSAVLRLTSDSPHKPKENSLLRLTASTLVYLYDPRLRKRGRLDERSIAFLRNVILKTQELGSYDHSDRDKVDISKFPWLSHMDRFAPYRKQRKEQAVGPPRAPTARELMPPPPRAVVSRAQEHALNEQEQKQQPRATLKRKASQLDLSPPEPSTPVSRGKYSHPDEATPVATTISFGTPSVVTPIATTSNASAPTSEPTTGGSTPKINFNVQVFHNTVKKMSEEERRKAIAHLEELLAAVN